MDPPAPAAPDPWMQSCGGRPSPAAAQQQARHRRGWHLRCRRQAEQLASQSSECLGWAFAAAREGAAWSVLVRLLGVPAGMPPGRGQLARTPRYWRELTCWAAAAKHRKLQCGCTAAAAPACCPSCAEGWPKLPEALPPPGQPPAQPPLLLLLKPHRALPVRAVCCAAPTTTMCPLHQGRLPGGAGAWAAR